MKAQNARVTGTITVGMIIERNGVIGALMQGMF